MVHHDGRYLLVRRAAAVTAGGYWTPVTGKIEPGESLRDAAIREVAEEVGLDVGCGAEVFRCPTQHAHWMLVWHVAPLRGPDSIDLNLTELAEARWVSAAEAVALEPMFPATRAFYAALIHKETAC